MVNPGSIVSGVNSVGGNGGSGARRGKKKSNNGNMKRKNRARRNVTAANREAESGSSNGFAANKPTLSSSPEPSQNNSKGQRAGQKRKRLPGSSNGSLFITQSPAVSTTSVTTSRAPKNPKRAKEKPAKFTHSELDSELRRLGRPWLSPGDPLFASAVDCSYQGFRHVPSDSVPASVHKGFRRAFDALHEAGLFMYDTVQAGGKRLSRTFVTRTLVGDAGITYKYLGLRLFAHPWDENAESNYRSGPGDVLADVVSDLCLADLFPRTDDDSKNGNSRRGGDGGAISNKTKQESGVGGSLQAVGRLSGWMRARAAVLLKEKAGVRIGDAVDDGGTGTPAGGTAGPTGTRGRTGGEGAKGNEHEEESATKVGSCKFNLTLINRMECSSAKRDLKPDPLFAMGKCSVSWHADSCLQDFSTIGVYHCTEPVPVDPDWGIAVRVSQEAGTDPPEDGHAETASGLWKLEKMNRGDNVVAPMSGEATAEGPGEKDVLTPPLLVPLRSGDAYFLLDDFNHFHEHAVVSGSSTLRYSSTHRVAATESNTFSDVQARCEAVLASSSEAAVDDRQVLALAQVRAEQALLTELESEWLNQFWVQGRRHAILHPWWRGPMALLLLTWRELERRTGMTVKRLLSLPQQQQQQQQEAGTTGPEPVAISRAFDTVLRALEERKESRSKWDLRFEDSAYRSLPPDCAPVKPDIWSDISISSDDGRWQGELPLPKGLGEVIARLRECYTEAYRAASGGRKAGSGKAIAAGAASNWEIFRATAAANAPAASSVPPTVVSFGIPSSASAATSSKNKKKRRNQASRQRQEQTASQQKQEGTHGHQEQQKQQQSRGYLSGNCGRWSSGSSSAQKAGKRGKTKKSDKKRRRQ